MINGIKLNVECVYLLYNVTAATVSIWTIDVLSYPLSSLPSLFIARTVCLLLGVLFTWAIHIICLVDCCDCWWCWCRWCCCLDLSSMVKHLVCVCVLLLFFPFCLHVSKMWFMSVAYKWTLQTVSIHQIPDRDEHIAQMGNEHFIASTRFLFFHSLSFLLVTLALSRSFFAAVPLLLLALVCMFSLLLLLFFPFKFDIVQCFRE